MIPLDELEKLALKAKTYIEAEYIHDGMTKNFHQFQDALSPDVVLELITEVRRLREENHGLTLLCNQNHGVAEERRAQLEEARKALEIYALLDAEDKKIK